MTQSESNLKSFLTDNYSKAQLRLVELKGKAQATLKDSSGKSKERIDELVEALSVKEMVERIKATEATLVTDLFEQLGFVKKEKLAELEATVAELTIQLKKLTKKAPAKKATAKKATAKKATAKKATAKKATPAKKAPPAKKA